MGSRRSEPPFDVGPVGSGIGERLRPGDVVADRFCVERLLGVGGMGAVFAATDRVLERRVALKIMLAESARDPVAAERFRREARVAVRLESPHAARMFDFGRTAEGEPFIVMEHLEGSDLESHLRDSGPLPACVAVDYVLQACEALAEAHALGVVHRDVKLRNLFLTRSPDGLPLVKVLDFGIAKTIDIDLADPSLTTTNALLGSPAYMAPEQLRAAGRADERTDVWALGVCLFELLTGHLPFEAASVAEVCALVLEKSPPPPSAWVADIEPDIDAVVARCLERDPATRFQSVCDLAAALTVAAGACARTAGSAASQRTSIPRPLNETARLAALRRYRVLDTAVDEDFGFLAELAAVVCAAPLAFITFVDEHRVWYKAWHGIDVDALEMARDDDYCSWTILEDTLLHIPDLTQDGRGATISTTVGEPHLRMYCGANLITPDGHRIGTLCVVDTVARELTSDQQRRLTKLARQVMSLVELRAKQAEMLAAMNEMKRIASSML